MLSQDDYEILISPQVREAVEAHLGDDPLRLAFSQAKTPHLSHILTQIKYLQRCRMKLPSYYGARCVIPPLSYEQSSSEASASAKEYSGALCIDLTCGLGVDSFYFSKRFGRVVAVERDGVLAAIARFNFGLLGADNITVANTTAEEFISNYTGPKADLIYVDPARRSETGSRVFLLADCSPDVMALLPAIMKITKRCVLKLSPLFDVAEAFRVLGGGIRCEVVSVAGECKELLVEVDGDCPDSAPDVGSGRIVDTIVGKDGRVARYAFSGEGLSTALPDEAMPGPFSYLLIPDAAFYKSRTVAALFRGYFPGFRVYVPSPGGYCFADEAPPGHFPGRVCRIKEQMPYNPRKIKAYLKENGIKNIEILQRDFPFSDAQIKKNLGISAGGTIFVAFTRVHNNLCCFILEHYV